ncbi:non-canonical poly(A) RNA polymerase papd5 [Phtheirospermum japonicum]|uniref:polynucleotide adenylyltransferase n=1 Tax=Phtheirospermum japonicum TaxID=374723 RepID=A0A830C4G3_9LAMI|nr:non-canonical poly(A) RNA polymerase papd5 [Phtheirospermum japonicum]
METQQILYETLTPLGTTAADATPSHSELEPYVVLRNQASLSTDQRSSLESAAPDYFSLDVNEPEDREASILATPTPLPTPSAPAAKKTLEGNWFRANCRFKSPMLRLHKEILDFCDFLSPTPEEQESRNAAIASVSDVIKYIWPDAEVEVFGSFKTGLYIPSSDIDVVIMGSNVRSPQMGLYALSRALSQRGVAKKIQVIAKARVPIIKFVEKKSGVAFDISFDVENGPRAAEYIKVYSGGIGSYALLSMLIAMLRTRHDRKASPEHNLGILLVNFFDMYGCKLNTVDVGVACNGGGVFFRKSSKGFSVEGRPSLIAIEDPQAPENDIGKNSFNYYQARSAFATAFTTLTNAKAISQLGPNRSILGAIIRPDSVLLERKGGSTGKLTFNNLFPDSAEPLQQLLGGDDQQDIYCNWPSNDQDEEPLPRGNGVTGNSDVKSSGKKRKASKEKKSGKVKVAKARGADKHENVSVKESSTKNQSWGHHQSGGGGGSGSGSRANGYGGGSSLGSRSRLPDFHRRY